MIALCILALHASMLFFNSVLAHDRALQSTMGSQQRPGARKAVRHNNALSSTKVDDGLEHDLDNPYLKKSKKKKLTVADKRKRKRGYQKKYLNMRDMTYDELKVVKAQKKKENDVENLIRYNEKMLAMCKDMHELKDITLELADLLYASGDHEKAGKLYGEFIKLYPGTQEVEYAYFRAITCCFEGILESDRDQSRTKETLELTKRFLERADVFEKHIDDVLKIKTLCCERLIESEMNIINFYMVRNCYKAVQNRLAGLQKDFANTVDNLTPRLLTVEIELAFKQNKIEDATQKLVLLQEKYPDFNTKNKTVVAQAAGKKAFTNRF
jgi:outer membrane assembly lipoprotein YfiO